MNWLTYENNFKHEAEKNNIGQEKIKVYLDYAHKLFDRDLPIIYDQTHLSLILGLDNEYLHRISNSPMHFYRTFYIEKRNGKLRRIDEPLPDLKKVQLWILQNILYKIPCSRFAKAYVPGVSIKDNVKFHRKQKLVVAIDLKDFFPSIKSGRVLNVFLSMGYNNQVAVMLTKLCCLRECLPQGAPTSAYLSNLVMFHFDKIVSKYCESNKIRYTRYADDLTFSGNFNIRCLLNLIDNELSYLWLSRNSEKLKIMRFHKKQSVTGIVVNEKVQLPKYYRMKIRQEVYYIKKYGIEDHLIHIEENRKNYIKHLLGKINYSLFVNPKDEKMKYYREYINKVKNRENL